MYCYCLVSVRAARSLGIWERLLAASRPDSSPFLAMSSAACCSRTSQRRLVWPTEWYHSNGLWRDKLLKWWWSSLVYLIYEFQMKLYCDYGTSTSFLFGFLDGQPGCTTVKLPIDDHAATIRECSTLVVLSPRFLMHSHSTTWCIWCFSAGGSM